MKNLLDQIKQFDYSLEALDTIGALLNQHITEIPTIELILRKGRRIYRCRKNPLPFNFFRFETELSFRTDVHNIHEFGRCNFPYDPIFYGSVVSKDISGYETAVIETSSLVDNQDEIVEHEGHETYTIGAWELKEDIRIIVIPPSEVNKIGSSLNQEITDAYLKLESKFSLSENMKSFYDLLGHEFSKNMMDENNEHYCLSALISLMFLKNDIKGIAYPSFKTKQQSFNVVFKPQTVIDYFEFKGSMVGDLFKFNKIMFFRNLFSADVSEGIPLIYRPITSNIISTDREVIRFFNSKGIDENHIISVLLNQFTGRNNVLRNGYDILSDASKQTKG